MEGETSMLWRLGRVLGIDLVDPAQIHSGIETLPLYNLSHEKKVPLQEDSEWKWQETLKNPSQCNPEHGEELIAAFAEGIALELQENMEELGFHAKEKKD